MTRTLQPTLYLYADLECIPSQDMGLWLVIGSKHSIPDLDLDSIQPAANLKNPELIAADIDKRRAKATADHAAAVAKAAAAAEEQFRKLCLDAATGHVACVSIAFGEGQVDSFKNQALDQFADDGMIGLKLIGLAATLEGERRMLEGLINYIENSVEEIALDRAFQAWDRSNPRQLEDGRWQLDATPDGSYVRFVADKGEYLRLTVPRYRQLPVVVCHHAQFDVRYIWQRCIILGVPVPTWWPIDAKPWDADRVDDTMLAWAGAKGTIGLDRLCRALGIPGKPTDIDGSKVWDAVRAGRIDDVCSYCDGDVERLRAVHRRIRGIEQVRQEFKNLQIGEGWTPAGGEVA